MLTETEKTARLSGLGGSDAPAALGLSPFKTPTQLYLEKIGELRTDADSIVLRMGNAIEPFILSEFEDTTGLTVTDRQKKVVDPSWSKRWATLDGIADGCVVQAKSTGMDEEWGQEGTDEVPYHVLIQVHHEMACADMEMAYVPVLFFRYRQFKIYTVPRNNDLVDLITMWEKDFWRRVETKSPPQPANAADLALLYPHDDGGTIDADEEAIELHRSLLSVRATAKEVKLRQEAIEFQLKNIMADHAILVGPGGKPLATWKSQTARRFATKQFAKDHPDLDKKYRVTSESRVLRIKEPK